MLRLVLFGPFHSKTVKHQDPAACQRSLFKGPAYDGAGGLSGERREGSRIGSLCLTTTKSIYPVYLVHFFKILYIHNVIPG